MSKPGIDELWTAHLKKSTKTTQCWACTYCVDRRIFSDVDNLWRHCREDHNNQVPANETEQRQFRRQFLAECARKQTCTNESKSPALNELNQEAEPPPQKRPLSSPGPTSLLGRLQIDSAPHSSEDVMQDISTDGGQAHEQSGEQPRKRVARGSAGSGSPIPFRESEINSQSAIAKRPTSAPGPYNSESENRQGMLEAPRPHVGNKQLWSPQDGPTSFPRSSVDPSNIASAQIQAQRSRAHNIPPKARKSFPSSPQIMKTPLNRQTSVTSSAIGSRAPTSGSGQVIKEDIDMMLQPETRPISQEQLVAEVKGIYAGLVMVEAKCIEVDSKQATLAHADGGNPPKLNNEQWQALIALHRTLLHEHHDFFLASQHPSASPALRRLASKYAMPARMWRHGIHSFLELLRHRLPASLDHMLAFIYLAYSMMALLYETVPAFEDTWIECLGDLGRYRMAIEDDDIRDREVWTGVARHWYSKASNKAPTTGRLYHHLAILARPNALQQLFYYSKSLCVAVPFSSARESILTLFEPVLNADNGQGQYRLPPLDTAFVKAHGLLFTNKEMQKFDHTVDEFLSLLNTQIGRVTRKFMEQGYHISVANHVAMLGFASSDNILMKIISQHGNDDSVMEGTLDVSAQSMAAFKNARHLSNSSIKIVLDRVGDPNVLPFIHITLIFMLFMGKFSRAMDYLQDGFPWEALATMLNTLLIPYQTRERIELNTFPIPERDDPRPFPEDFAVRGLLWAEGYYPVDWFTKKKIDEEEKYHERASMTAQRKERILWLGCRLCDRVPYLTYNGSKFTVLGEEPTLASRASTFASATTTSSLDRAGTWESQELSAEEDMPSPPAMRAAESTSHD